MPTYEFRCPLGHEFERFYRTIGTAEAQTACPECGKMAERIMSVGAGLHFKGSGFYLTDYGKDAHKKKAPSDSKGEGKTAESSSAGGDGAAPSSDKAAGESAKSDAKPAESKPAPKPSSSE
ncbi:MAG: FmdB family transcriptional regulator [Gemmatimonadetes bacterium]|nr:MAG: FmdB family transcriptional regulator [Gemmatimonadota bacterium]